MTIRTARLDLVPGTAELLRAELLGPEVLATLLGVDVTDSWPPPLYDADATCWMLDRIDDDAAYETWGFHYFVLRDVGDRGAAAGAGGFKGPPAAGTPVDASAGMVEIGYSVLPEFQRQGLATEAVLGMLGRAYQDARVTHVIAETLPDLVASIGVLEKTGFRRVESSSAPAVLRFEHRPDRRAAKR